MSNAPEARIKMYIHCKTCIRPGKKNGKKVPIDHGEHLAVGYTEEGIQVVCEGCGQNVVDWDLLGQKIGYFDPDLSKKERKELINKKHGKKN